uniref:Uncharacterized protein n=1 Tax=Triticum urartu TaxID=4572 RepID=A0A8R7QLB4_TRIUA
MLIECTRSSGAEVEPRLAGGGGALVVVHDGLEGADERLHLVHLPQLQQLDPRLLDRLVTACRLPPPRRLGIERPLPRRRPHPAALEPPHHLRLDVILALQLLGHRDLVHFGDGVLRSRRSLLLGLILLLLHLSGGVLLLLLLLSSDVLLVLLSGSGVLLLLLSDGVILLLRRVIVHLVLFLRHGRQQMDDCRRRVRLVYDLIVHGKGAAFSVGPLAGGRPGAVHFADVRRR